MTTKYMCLFWKYIFPLILTTQVVTLIAAQPNADIMFKCDNAGNIISISQTGVDDEQILIQTKDKYCLYKNQTCKTNNVKPTLHVIIQTEKNHKIMGGNPNNIKQYLLECKDEHDVTASAKSFSAKPITTSTPLPTIIASFRTPEELTLTIKRGKTALTGSVYIGERLTLEMSMPTGYKVYPKECIAINGDDENDNVVIWTDISSTSSSPCSTYDHAITKEKWTFNTTTQTTTISIYAFQFIGSKEVTIRCRAHLCPITESGCSSSCMEDGARRRRRDSPLLKKRQPTTKTEEAQVSFRVTSESIVHNKANALSVRLTVIITAVIFGERFIRFI